ncbi:MAG: hypothetical protein Q9160_008314 [Pyrenula sp. 1 TL-2023]
MFSKLPPDAILLKNQHPLPIYSPTLVPFFQLSEQGGNNVSSPDWNYPLILAAGDGPSKVEGDTTTKPAKDETRASKSEGQAGDLSHEGMILDDDGCPVEDDTPFCRECGGGIQQPKRPPRKRREWRCKGIAEDGYKWKDCYCLADDVGFVPYEDPSDPTDEELAAD